MKRLLKSKGRRTRGSSKKKSLFWKVLQMGRGAATPLNLPVFQTANSTLVCREKMTRNVLSITHKGESHTKTL